MDNSKCCIIVKSLVIGSKCLQKLSPGFIPLSVTIPEICLFFMGKHGKGTLCTFLHHMVKTEADSIGQRSDKSILSGHKGKNLSGFRIPCNKKSHLNGKFISKSHNSEKFLLRIRKRCDHGRGKHIIDIRSMVRKMSALKKGTEIQIDCREPSFTGIEKRIQLIFVQAGTAAMGIDRKLPPVQTQIPGMDLI